MIKFFRNMRRRSLTKNKFYKYLLYAIGEIVLVVIGILIALQINNYSAYQKERYKETVLLSNLSNEIELDIQQIDNSTKLSTERLNRLDSIVQSLKNTDSIDKLNFILQSFELVMDQYFYSNSGIFDEAVSSGKMSYIQNDSLRQTIFDYYRNADESDNDGTTRLITDELITPLFIETLFMSAEGFSSLGMNVQDVSDLQSIDLEALKSNKDFWKMILLKFGSNQEQILRWQQIKVRAQKLNQQIEKELNKLKQ
ncbi:DUF6090 family protein [Tunicatimonas pelagia]|uniref:DUF6090 family protein n=1 Tax=Tunicatimonas pelagia TaxID=931531 RepID=UPI002666A842|nr:DUF6090 family protein [Tunicatimonas pelagia]WKN43919.1 DUF6090 family protein [Tunicatimonas pelagia]